jgi:LPXTG-motif cell wall-anchored protein
MRASLIFFVIMIVIILALPLTGIAGIPLLAAWIAVMLCAGSLLRRRRRQEKERS